MNERMTSLRARAGIATTLSTTATLPESYVEYLREVVPDNASSAVHKLVEWHRVMAGHGDIEEEA